MKSAIVLKLAAAALVVGLAGCTDLKPLQAEVADLKSQVGQLQSDVAGRRSRSADQANSAAQSASQAASGAQSTANQALSAAQAASPLRCDQREDRPHVQAVGFEVSSTEA